MRVSIVSALLAGFVSAQRGEPPYYTMWDTTNNGALPTPTAWADQLAYIADTYSEQEYTIERHDGIVTDDDYVLELWRVELEGSANSSGRIVVLGHGANTNGLAWFDNGEDSIAYQLLEAGYDVWVVNDRMSGVSMTPHVTLDTDDAQFWDMSFIDVGLYDLPAAFSYAAANNTNASDKVTYIGHSTGTTAAFTALSYGFDTTDADPTNPSFKYADFLDSFVALSPLIKFGHLGDELEHISQWAYHMQTYIEDEGWTHLNMDNQIIDGNGDVVTIPEQTWQDYADDADEASSLEQIAWMVDEWPDKFQHPGYQKYDNHHADFKNELNSYTPLKQLIHIGQIGREGTPLNFNYLDAAVNTAAYGDDDPPTFPIDDITTKMYIVQGHKDKINREDDQDWLKDTLDATAATFKDINGSHKTPLQHQDMSWFSNVLTFIAAN